MLIPGDEGEKRTKGGKTERRAKTKKKSLENRKKKQSKGEEVFLCLPEFWQRIWKLFSLSLSPQLIVDV